MSIGDVTITTLFDNYWLATGTTVTSSAVDIGALSSNGYFSLQVRVLGSGSSICAGYSLSNDGVNFVYPSSDYTIVAGSNAFHHQCGASKDGREFITISPVMGARMKIVFWETAGTGSTITAHLAVN